MCLTKIKQFFTRKKKEQPAPAEVPEKKRPPRKWWEFPFRIIDTSKGGPDMPKRQRCPQCRAFAKRHHKTLTGAEYHCRCGESFLVLHPHPTI